MNNKSIVQKKVILVTISLIFLLIVTGASVYAACVTPTKGMTISSSTTFCKGTYTLTDVSNNIKVRGDNIVLDCDGATIQGDYKTKLTTGISLVGNDITLKNCNIKGYSTCVSLTNYGVAPTVLMKNAKIINNNFTRCDGLAGIFTDGQSNFDISNNRFVNFGDYYERAIGSHAVYISAYDQDQAAQAGKVYNNYIYNMSASGVKINGYGTIRNIKIYGNTISRLAGTQGDAYGVHIADVSNVAVYDNDFVGPYDSGVVLNVGSVITHYANNNNIYNNKFSNLDTAVWSKSNNYNNYIHDNDYSNNGLDIRMSSKASFIVYEQDPLKMGAAWNAYLVNMAFSGKKNFTVSSYNLSIRNGEGQWTPYNDIRNKETGAIIASNVKSYSMKLVESQEIEIGNYVKDPVEVVNVPPNAPSVSIKSKDNTVNSDINCTAYIDDPDSSKLNVTYQWFKNGALNKTNYVNNQDPRTYVSNILSKSSLKVGDKWYCNVRVHDGKDYSTWTKSSEITIASIPAPIVNQPPNSPVVTIKSKDNTLNSDINCSAYIDDPDSSKLNTTIQWYKNGALNKTNYVNNQNPRTYVSNILSKSSLKVEDKWYCRIRVHDGKNYSDWVQTNTVTIAPLPVNSPPTIDSITLYSYDNTVDNDLLCILDINDANSDSMNLSIHWYKNGALDRTVTKNNQKSGQVAEPLSKSVLRNDDAWQCRVRVYDGKNYSSWSQSNIITIKPVVVNPDQSSPRKSGGGGGGGSSSLSGSSPIVVKEKPVVEEPIVEEAPIIILENPEVNDEEIQITTQSMNVEEPKTVDSDMELINDDSVSENKPKAGLWILLIGVMITGATGFVAKKRLTVETNQQMLYYILKKLNDGYSYYAISEVLKKKGYSDRVIDHHTKILMSEGHEPQIKFPGSQKYSIPASKKAKLVNTIQEYTRIHINEGFRLNDIKQVLLYSGHPMDLIEEAIYG